MRTWWHCIGSLPQVPPCGASGVYEHTAKSGSSGPADKHTRETTHATSSASVEWRTAV